MKSSRASARRIVPVLTISLGFDANLESGRLMEERVQLPSVEIQRVCSLAYERLRLRKGIRDEYYHNKSPKGGIVSGHPTARKYL